MELSEHSYLDLKEIYKDLTTEQETLENFFKNYKGIKGDKAGNKWIYKRKEEELQKIVNRKNDVNRHIAFKLLGEELSEIRYYRDIEIWEEINSQPGLKIHRKMRLLYEHLRILHHGENKKEIVDIMVKLTNKNKNTINSEIDYLPLTRKNQKKPRLKNQI